MADLPVGGATLTLEGNDVGRDVGQLEQDPRQGGMKQVQAVLGVPGLLEGEPTMRHEAGRGCSHPHLWAKRPRVLGLVVGQRCTHPYGSLLTDQA